MLGDCLVYFFVSAQNEGRPHYFNNFDRWTDAKLFDDGFINTLSGKKKFDLDKCYSD